MTLKTNKTKIKIYFLLIISLASLALAASGDGIKITSPTSGSNYTSISSILFNVSFINGTDITQPSNASFFLNISGTWTKIGNTSASNGCQVLASTGSFCAATITNTSIPDGVYSINATIFNSTRSISVIYAANLSNLIYIDSTPPISTTSNFSAPFSAGANLSSANGGLFTINLSIVDATIGVQTVLVNITNRSSGISNATLTLTREGSTNNFVATINTTHYLDGSYNITVIANDSLNNVNNSAVLQNIIFDSTAPEVSLSCSPNPVNIGETITCSCSASDATAGINRSYGTNGASTTVHPSTSQTGPSFSVGCTSQDLAGNSRSVTTTYSVVESGSSSNGGGASLSPPASSDEGKKKESSNGPDTTVQSSDQGAGTESGSSSKGISTTSKLLITIIIAAAIVIVGAYIIRRRK